MSRQLAVLLQPLLLLPLPLPQKGRNPVHQIKAKMLKEMLRNRKSRNRKMPNQFLRLIVRDCGS
jgi:hypothetical protein